MKPVLILFLLTALSGCASTKLHVGCKEVGQVKTQVVYEGCVPL